MSDDDFLKLCKSGDARNVGEAIMNALRPILLGRL